MQAWDTERESFIDFGHNRVGGVIVPGRLALVGWAGRYSDESVSCGLAWGPALLCGCWEFEPLLLQTVVDNQLNDPDAKQHLVRMR
jgi:hypothetical protein